MDVIRAQTQDNACLGLDLARVGPDHESQDPQNDHMWSDVPEPFSLGVLITGLAQARRSLPCIGLDLGPYGMFLFHFYVFIPRIYFFETCFFNRNRRTTFGFIYSFCSLDFYFLFFLKNRKTTFFPSNSGFFFNIFQQFFGTPVTIQTKCTLAVPIPKKYRITPKEKYQMGTYIDYPGPYFQDRCLDLGPNVRSNK